MKDVIISRNDFIKSQCNMCDGNCDNVNCDCINCRDPHRCDFIKDLYAMPSAEKRTVISFKRARDAKKFIKLLKSQRIIITEEQEGVL